MVFHIRIVEERLELPRPAKHTKGAVKKNEATSRREIGPVSEKVEATRLAAKQRLFDLHDKARSLFEDGKYRESFETFVEYGDQMSKTKGLAGTEAAILEAARKFESLKFWYEAGNLYLIAANFLNNVGVTMDAGDFYLAAAETLEKATDKNLKGLIASCYAAASRTLRNAKKLAESDKALIKGVLATTGRDPLEIESSASKSLKANDLQTASQKFREAAIIYREAIDELSGLATSVQEGSLEVDVKSTLHHRAAQNLLASAACESRSGNRRNVVNEIMTKAADEFTRAVINFTPLFTTGDVHKIDSRRYAYDLMMGTALRIALGSTEDIGTLQDQLSAIDKKRTKELEESGYLAVALALMKTKKIRNVITDLTDVNLGSVEELKDSIIELLLKPEIVKK
jgi:tetratricopeptide (TPR) repeat protein